MSQLLFIQAVISDRVIQIFGRSLRAMRSLTMRDQFVVDGFAAAHRDVQPAFDAAAHQFLGVGELDVVHADRDVEFVRLVEDRAIERRRQRRLSCRCGRRPRS